MTSIFETLEQRGFIAQCSDPALREILATQKVAVYVGFDPTADSLHLGHLLPIMALAHFQRAGHRVLALVGGATGMIGDPSGKSDERNLLTPDEAAHNAAAVKEQLARFLDFTGPHAAVLLDNSAWISKMSFVDWLREVGKHFTVNYMLAKESVKSRLGAEGGISYTEFSYMTMQAYDFLHLYDTYGCSLQCGGTDQWGNITAGIDLMRKTRGAQGYGITFPLVTTSTGEKFGKTAGNAVWLDPDRTSPYQLYQYWIGTDDRDVEAYLKLFTFLDVSEIAGICAAHRQAPETRQAQRRLAAELTRLVHGDEGLRKAEQATQVLFGAQIAGLSDRELLEIFADVPSASVPTDELAGGIELVGLLARTGACASKSQARKLIQGGGVYVNNRRVSALDATVTRADLASESILVLRTGKKSYHLVRFA